MQGVYAGATSRRRSGIGAWDFEDLLSCGPAYDEHPEAVTDFRALPRDHRRRVPGRQPAAPAGCSTTGPVTGRLASSATTTRRSTRSRARHRNSCCGRGARSSGSRRTTARRRRFWDSPTGSRRSSVARESTGNPAGGRGAVLRACEDAEAEVTSIVGEHPNVPAGGRAVRGDRGAQPSTRGRRTSRRRSPARGPVPGARRCVPGQGGAGNAPGAARVGRAACPDRRGGRTSAGTYGRRPGRSRRGGADAPGRPRALATSGKSSARAQWRSP